MGSRRCTRSGSGTKDPLPDEPFVQACAQAFASDFGLALSARWGRADPYAFTTASLDHSVWFPRPARISDWLLLSTTALSVASGRCLVHGSLHTTDGALAATIAQVALVRPLSGRERFTTTVDLRSTHARNLWR
jgi:acyl-CoA thioesterase-2